MSIITMMFIAALANITGTITRGKAGNVDVVIVGNVGAAIVLSLLGDVDHKLAELLALAFMITSLTVNAEPLLAKYNAANAAATQPAPLPPKVQAGSRNMKG